MEYVTVGATGVQVSPLCFGTMTFGGEADEPTSAALYAAARDAGINFFDTANVYSEGGSEGYSARLGGFRDDLVISSKVLFPIRPDVNARGLSRRHILKPSTTAWTVGHGSSRLLLRPRFRRADSDRADSARAGPSGAAGQSYLPRRQQLGGVADRHGAGRVRRGRRWRGSSWCSRCTTW